MGVWCESEAEGPVLCDVCAEMVGRVAEADHRGDGEAVELAWCELEARYLR
jgi:hypothetical protein